MLNALALSQTTDIDKTTKRNFVNFQALSVLNFTLPKNLTIHGQSDVKTIQTYLQTFIRIPSPISVFNDYQKTTIFQIPSDQNFAFQIAKPDFSYIRLNEIIFHFSYKLIINYNGYNRELWAAFMKI